MRNRTTTPAGLLLLGLVGALLAPTQASAQTWTKHDPHDPGRYVHDISRIKVSHGPRNVWVRTMFFPRVKWVNITSVFIDTRPGNPGPEFHIYWNDMWPHGQIISRIGRWHGPAWHERTCPRANSRVVDGDVLMKIPRRCLRIGGARPARIRVSVNAYDEQFPRRTEDWAPRKQRFGRFVRSS
ncbi:MAG: hypothetical protein L0H93_15120 [Nocardioides sp.]|nr:hypothetical protein [Nocardioides sp.]